MKTVISPSEFSRWVRYFQFKQPDETEIQLATLALLVSVGLGNKKAKYDDFLVNKPRVDIKQGKSLTEKIEGTNHSIMTSDAVRAVFGGIAIKQG